MLPSIRMGKVLQTEVNQRKWVEIVRATVFDRVLEVQTSGWPAQRVPGGAAWRLAWLGHGEIKGGVGEVSGQAVMGLWLV